MNLNVCTVCGACSTVNVTLLNTNITGMWIELKLNVCSGLWWMANRFNKLMLQAGERERERERKLMTMEPVSMISDAYNVGIIHDCAICNRRFCFFRFVFLPIHRTFQLNIPLEKVENRSHFLIVAFFYNINRLVVLTLTTVPFMPCK